MKTRLDRYRGVLDGLRWATVAALILTIFCVPSIVAQTTCVGPATGVPANGTPPDWFVSPATAVYAHDTDDPRWVGAGSVSMGNGTNNIVDFRALQNASFLYFSWRIQHVSLDTHDDTLLYFGFPQPAGDPLIIKVNLKLNDAHSDEIGAVAALSAVTRNSIAPVGQGTVASLPAWVNDATNGTLRVWSQTIGPTKAQLNSWAVQVRVPRSAVQFSGSTFKLWFEVMNSTPATPVVDIQWPAGAAITQDVSFNDIYPDITGAGGAIFQPSTGSSDPLCATAGVSLDVNQIGTLYVDPNPPNLPDPHHINLFSANTFFARPKNQSGSSVGANQIVARFRIANWGSNPMGWEAGVDDSTLWADIPGGSSVSNADSIGDGTTAHGDPLRNDIEFSWTLSPAERSQFVGQGGTRLLHQCMLVELSSPGSVRFVNNSIRTNMNFAPTSTFKDTAELTIKGLPSIAPDGRDVYVWVETLNMPKVIKPDTRPGLLKTLLPSSGNFTRGNEGGIPKEGQPIAIPGLAKLQQMLLTGETTFERVEEVVPTYIVHVYHDTGKKLRLGGIDRPVLVEQGAFGYFVHHDGSLYGWQHELVGDGFTLEKIAEDFYRIKKMPNDGSVRVSVKIEALEHPQLPPLNKFAVFADLGAAIPNGTFSNVVNTGFSFNGGLEYIVNSHFSAEGILGVHHFPGKIAGDVTAIQFTGGGKVYLTNSPNRVFARAGLGGYHFTSATTNFGGYFGAGLLHEFNSHFGLEGVYTFHAVNTPGTATKFSTVQGGVRYAF